MPKTVDFDRLQLALEQTFGSLTFGRSDYDSKVSILRVGVVDEARNRGVTVEVFSPHSTAPHEYVSTNPHIISPFVLSQRVMSTEVMMVAGFIARFIETDSS